MNTNLLPEFVAHFIVRGKIECKTGLHIGGSKEKLEIGGVDSIVIRSPRTEYPYIPGSSLKGKMRHLLEYITGAVGDPVIVERKNERDPEKLLADNIGNVSKAPHIVRLFGIGADEKDSGSLKYIGLSRLTVRDASPDDETIRKWKGLGSDANYTEYKAENTIDRLTSAANPRFIERVVEGSFFNFEIVYTLYQMPEEIDYLLEAQKDLNHLLTGLRLLEASALGKSGTRGYGKIAFHLAEPHLVTKADYQEGSDNWKSSKGPLPDALTSLEALPDDWFNLSK
jgi:CRISPR-associated protein Csm3